MLSVAVFLALLQCTVSIALRDAFSTPQSQPGLYGLLAHRQLVYLYPNATVVPIGTPLPKGVQAAQLCTLDEAAGTWYSILLDETTDTISLVGISVQNGSVVSTAPVPYDAEHGIGAGQLLAWTGTSGVLLAGGLLDPNHPKVHVVSRVDLGNGTWTEVTRINTTFMPPLASTQAAAYVPDLSALVFELGTFTTPNIVQLNLTSGRLAHYKGVDVNILSMSYDPVSQLVYGIATQLQNSSYVAVLAVLDPQTLTISIAGSLSEFEGMDTGVAALDPAGRSLYWVGMKRDDPDGPNYLIQTALANATTISASPLAQHAASLVGLQYLSAPS